MHRHWTGVELGEVQPIINRLCGLGNEVEPPRQGDAAKGIRGASARPTGGVQEGFDLQKLIG